MPEHTPLGALRARSASATARKRVRRGLRRSQAQWDVLLQDQHEGYITRSEFERNQQVIADNATGKWSASARGAVRTGGLLLAGLLRCGHCGSKLYVGYGGKTGRCTLFLCSREPRNATMHLVWRIRADDAVEAEVLRV